MVRRLEEKGDNMKQQEYTPIPLEVSPKRLKTAVDTISIWDSALKSQIRAILIVMLGVMGVFVDKLPMIILIAYGFYELNNITEHGT